MRAALGMVGLLIVLAIGYFIYSAQIGGETKSRTLVQQPDLVAVKGRLLSLGQSERLYLAANGSYATLEQLQQPDITGDRGGYVFTAEVDGAAHFRITAKPADSSNADLPTLSIDETMQISQ
jgi:hypothetical protein